MSDKTQEFPQGKEAYCPECYFTSDPVGKVVLRKDCPGHDSPPQTDKPSVPYNQIDHFHCWEQTEPPCGIRGEHRCCLCTLPVPEHEPSEGQFGNVGGRCSPGVSTTPTPQQEEASWENQFDRTFYWEIYKRGDIKAFIRTEIAQAEKRGEVRTLEWVLNLPYVSGEEMDRWIQDRLTALKNPTHD